jgi:HD-GYP domain-containing protein (c-di-GMP phosphodiesterase class II)
VFALETIKTFLDSMTAVSQTRYQIWDAKGRMVFSTEQKAPDFLTMSSHLKMAKKVIMSDAFTYAPLEHNGFICGIPLGMNEDTKGAILATGTRPTIANDSGHPSQLNTFLEQVLMIGQSGDHNTRHIPQKPDTSFEDLYLFANLSKQFRSLRFKQPILGKLMHRMFDSMEADAAFLRLPQTPQYDLLEVRQNLLGNNGDAESRKNELEWLITAGTKQCLGNYCIVNNSMDEPAFEDLANQPFRFLAVAVRHIRKTFGWLGLVSYNMDVEFKPEELNILQTLANQLAAMMANMAQQDDLERFTVNIICSLVNAIEAKDAYTQGHSKRVHQYAMQMAKRLNISAENRDALKWASVLHDIGKIGIPERILRKPGKLTKKEFQLIKEHPVKGRNILSPIRQLAPSMEPIAYHHERFDGRGYPEGLKGEEIPLAARIIAVADTFDAITSKRSYRSSKKPQEAFLVLDQVAGTQLDPHLVKVFKQTMMNS